MSKKLRSPAVREIRKGKNRVGRKRFESNAQIIQSKALRRARKDREGNLSPSPKGAVFSFEKDSASEFEWDNEKDLLSKVFQEDMPRALNYILARLPKSSYEDRYDIFIDSLELVRNKYIRNPIMGVNSQERTRMILYGVIKNNIKVYKRKKLFEALDHHQPIEEDRFDNFNEEEYISANMSDIELLPPSVYAQRKYQREYYQKTKEARNERQRIYYRQNHSKMLEIGKDPKAKERRRINAKRYYWEQKADPKKYAEYRKKKNDWRRKQRAAKREGVWTDQRFYKNREHTKLKAPIVRESYEKDFYSEPQVFNFPELINLTKLKEGNHD